MTWLVGVALDREDSGALRFASWWAREMRSQRLCAAHIINRGFLKSLPEGEGLDRIHDAASDALMRVIETSLANEFVDETIVQVHAKPEEALAAIAEDTSPDGIIVGRHSPANSRNPIRLGSVARRLLRRLPGTVIVVPPDIDTTAFESDTIVAATSLTKESVAACRYASEVARRTGRKLTIVHVVEPPGSGMPHYLPQYIPEATIEGLDEELTATGAKRLDAWLSDHAIECSETKILIGEPADQIAGFGASINAPLLIIGSRQLSTAQRIFRTSVGSALAATADRAVAVVPESAALSQ